MLQLSSSRGAVASDGCQPLPRRNPEILRADLRPPLPGLGQKDVVAACRLVEGTDRAARAVEGGAFREAVDLHVHANGQRRLRLRRGGLVAGGGYEAPIRGLEPPLRLAQLLQEAVPEDTCRHRLHRARVGGLRIGAADEGVPDPQPARQQRAWAGRSAAVGRARGGAGVALAAPVVRGGGKGGRRERRRPHSSGRGLPRLLEEVQTAVPPEAEALATKLRVLLRDTLRLLPLLGAQLRKLQACARGVPCEFVDGGLQVRHVVRHHRRRRRAWGDGPVLEEQQPPIGPRADALAPQAPLLNELPRLPPLPRRQVG
mmetsp:Transcript_124653/g.360621  ORF Transcript_124653/g.360621 Transcript_124653/m.360621 type:complete len:315 (+) Transcript_124653:329-1273(+)